MNSHSTPKPAPIRLNADSGSFETFLRIVSQTADPSDTPHATEVIRNIPVYDGARVEAADREAILLEWGQVLSSGAGIIIIRQGLPDHAAIDRASQVFDRIIADEARGE
jgi:hypothetical protein